MKKSTIILSAAKLAAAVLGLSLVMTSCKNDAEANAETTAANGAAELVKPEDTTGSLTGKAAFVNMDQIYQQYGMAIDLSAALEKKSGNIQAEIEKRGKKLENEVKAFQDKVQKGLMTRSTAEMEGQKLQQKEADLNQYVAQKQQEMQEETFVTTNQINNAIITFINKFNEEKKYDMILTNQGPVPFVIAANAKLNITAEIIEGLNAEYHATNAEKTK